ncbi:hypothetical protein B0H15DRAFT_543784 [Mycena belliarum]|uniref:Sld7 C-terminal domain-containing protein n=1 Tax=Mycena belliarum TaxID=1033014 RepID=A0AAD6XTU7_9AGAR|nr:hypothetical protein B0H15DRAFT_543784 [Mycena belliae]
MFGMAEVSPAINITQPTPPRTAAQFRLLYRGALSLPDSHLLLDGLTFAARLDHLSPGHNLLQNPLALALESMRKRPSLRLMGLTKLASIYMDETGDISMDIHPSATLTRIYFENIFCLDPATSLDSGIKVALGDSDGPDTTEMVIFARAQGPQLQLIVARITPAPPPRTLLRLPRPDDPTPRRPPIRFDRSASAGANPFAGARKRTTSVADLGSGVRLGVGAEAPGAFKIPEMPRIKREASADEDVFGAGAVVENKGKRKRGEEESESENQMEKANKTIIKQSAMHHLSIPKTHPEYKDVYGAVYRGVGFALRAEMKRTAVDLKAVERLVKIHVNMYAPADTLRSAKGHTRA